MNTLRDILHTRDRRIWVLMAIVVIGLIFSIVKIAGAFGNHPQPAYQNTPPTAFASAPQNTLFAQGATSAPRLPDDAYRQIFTSMHNLVPGFANFKVSSQALQAAGMSRSAAASTIQQLDDFQTQESPTGGQASNSYSLQGELTPSAVTTVATVTYDVSDQALPVTLAFSYASSDSVTWHLTQVQVESGAVANTSGS